MSILIIGPEEQKSIDCAIEKARSRPTPLSILESHGIPDKGERKELKLSEVTKEASEARQKYLSQQVMLGTYRCAISFEHQKFGLCRHLSVSSSTKGMIPNDIAMDMILDAFGFNDAPAPGSMWVEEFEPGWNAINVIKAVTP